MASRKPAFLTRMTATVLVASLIILTPGPGAYEAAATVIRVPVKVAAPVSGAAGATKAFSTDVLSRISLNPAGGAPLSAILPTVSSQLLPPAVPLASLGDGVLADTGAGYAGLFTAPPAASLSVSPNKENKAVSPQERLSGIAQDSVKLSADTGNLSNANLKSAADFTLKGRSSQAATPVPLASLGNGRLKNRLLSKDSKKDSAPAFEPESPKAVEKAEHLVFDIHQGYFKAGYVAATVWQAGTSLELPKAKKSFGRNSQKERGQFINGLAYRIAELAKSEAAGQKFLAASKDASDEKINVLLNESLSGYAAAPASLRENLSDADYVQGYLTGMSWRPGKQLLMPAPSLADKFKFGLRQKMKSRDQRFMDGLYSSLEDARAQQLKEKMAEGPQPGMRDFGTKLGYMLTEVMSPLYDKALDGSLPYLPGKIEIPRSLKGLIIGHMVFIMFGIYMHVSAQPYLVYGLTGSKTMMGVVRNVHFGAYSASSFLPIGPAIDKTDFRTMFIWTSVSRALLMGAIPLLFFSGYMTFGVLLAIVALNPMFQSLMTNSDTAARDSILGTDENVVREGSAFGTKVSAIGGLVIPAAAAWVVSQFVVAFGSPGGYAMAYAGYGVMLLLAIPIFMLMVRDPRYYDPSVKQKPSTNPLNIFMPMWTVLKLPYKAVRWAWGKIAKRFGRSAEVKISGDAAAVLAQAKEREVPFIPGRRMKNLRERVARFFDKIEATQGLSIILRSDTLSLLVAITAIELFIADALMFVLIPNYIIDVIRPVAELASVPIIGSMLTTPVGIMGLMLTAGAVGRYLGSRWASGPKGARRIKKWGHKTLYRAAAISGLTFWAMLIPTFFIAPAGAAGAVAMSIPLFVGAMTILLAFEFAMSLLATPLGIAMSPVRRKQIPNDMVGKVSAAFTMVDVGLMAAGALAIGILIDLVPIQIAVIVIAIAITLTSILEWFAPGWLKKINPEGWEHGEISKPANKSDAKK